jgi:dihydrofolate synthase/folylpolyglutamate synthase
MPDSLFEVIGSVGAIPVVPGRDYSVSHRGDTWSFELGGTRLERLPLPSLAGRLQPANAATALAALAAGGFREALTHANVARALREVRIRGRFQVVPGEVEWVLDVAHNVPAAEGLRANLEALPRKRTIAVCGVLGDKDIAGITATLSPAIDGWVLAGLEGPRSVKPSDLAGQLPAGAQVLAAADDVRSACRLAREACRPGDRILVFGSFLTVGPALEFLGI